MVVFNLVVLFCLLTLCLCLLMFVVFYGFDLVGCVCTTLVKCFICKLAFVFCLMCLVCFELVCLLLNCFVDYVLAFMVYLVFSGFYCLFVLNC